MHLTILDRYIFREAVLTWAAVTFVLFAIMISHTLLRVLVKAGGGEIALASVLPLLLATSINLLVTIVPLGVYLGILLGLGRMYQDSEMVVLSASGCGPAKLYRPVLALGILCLLITFPLTVWVSPWAESWEQRIKSKTSDDNLASAVRPGEFVELQQGDLVLFARNFSPDGVLTDVFLRQIDEQSSEALEVASTAHYQTDLKTGEQYLVFVDGQRTVFDAQNAQTQVIDFGNHGVRIPEQSASSIRQSRRAKSTATLMKSDNVRDHAEFLWRVFIPLAAPALAFLAMPLAHTTPRQGRYGKLALGILIYIGYTNLLVLSRKWVANGAWPEWTGVWWVHILLLVLAYFFLQRMYGRSLWFGHKPART